MLLASISGKENEVRDIKDHIVSVIKEVLSLRKDTNLFFDLVHSFYSNYDQHRLNNVEQYIVKSIKKSRDHNWSKSIIDELSWCSPKYVENEFYIKLLKEMKIQNEIGHYSVENVEEIIDCLEQAYANVSDRWLFLHG